MNQLTKRQKELLHDEDVKEAMWKIHNQLFKMPSRTEFEILWSSALEKEFLSQFEEKKDWEIMKFKHNETGCIISLRKNGLYLNDFQPECDGQYSEKLLISAGRIIHSVKYKDQVFTIGDYVEHNGNTLKISEFEVDNERLKVWFSKGTWLNISEVKKVERKPLFVTEDGVEIYVDDEVFQISLVSNYTLSKMIYRETVPIPPPSYFKYFKSKEKAEEYILLNSPKLSVNDVKEELHNKYGERNETCNNILKRLTSLVKSKSK